MLLTEYLDSIENTDEERLFLTKIVEMKEELGQAKQIPIVGKFIKALIDLGDSGSIAEFKQCEHYENIMGYNIRIMDMEKGYFSMYPGKELGMKAAKIAAIVVAVVLLLCLCCKRCRRLCRKRCCKFPS